jgi:Flp pilus assembly protein TadD
MLLTGVIYYKSVSFGFINWDDDRNVYENQDIRSLSASNIIKIFSSSNLKMYQPLTTLSYAVEYKFKGADAHVFHFTNLLLHLLNTMLVFIFVFLLFRHTPASAFVAFLFALHPMHVESVVWITERKDVLYSFFYLLSLIAYIKYLINNKSYAWFILALVFFLFSLLSKSAAITLPLILFLIDFKNNRPINIKTIPDKIPFLLLSLTFGIISVFSQKVFDPTNEITLQFQFYERFVLGSYAFFFYLIKAVVPVALSALHPFPVKTSALLPLQYFIYFSGFLLLFFSLLWILIKKKYHSEKWKDPLFGFLFFCFTIGLIIFIPVGSALTAERYTYIPYIGLFISFFFVLNYKYTSFYTRIRNYIIYPVLIIWLAFLTVSTFYRIDVWKNSLCFWNDIIKKQPRYVPLAYNNRGVTKYLQKDYAGAIPDFTKALQQHPRFKGAYYYRALCRFSIKDYENSVRDYDTLLFLDPKYADGYLNRGQAKANLGDLLGAISDFNAATNFNPRDFLPFYNRGILYSIQGRKNEAYYEFSSAINLAPNSSDAYYARGMIALEIGNKPQACDDFNTAARLGNSSAQNQILINCR